MGFRGIISKIVASLLGITVISRLVNLFFISILTIFLVVAKPESINDWLWFIYSIGALAIVLGIYVGLKSYETKNIWYTIFRPTKKKALISLVLSIILVVVFVLSGVQPFVSSDNYGPVPQVLSILLVWIPLYFIDFYAFSAICSFIYRYRNDTIFRKTKVIVIILLILLNPVLSVLGGAIGNAYRYRIMNEPCGVRIAAFTEPSPAQESGMQVDEIILRINDVEIDTYTRLKEYMDSYDPSRELTIHTESKSYPIEAYQQEGRYLLGIYPTQEMCRHPLWE